MTNHNEHVHNHASTNHHEKFDPERLLKMESEWQCYMSPATILPKFLTRSDMTLVDLGCGAGYFTIPAAKMLNGGHVYAVDRQQDMVNTTLNRAHTQTLSNIEGIVALATNLPIPNGILYIIEWDHDDTEFGPPIQIRIRPDDLCTMLTDSQYVVQDISYSDVQPSVYFIEARTL